MIQSFVQEILTLDKSDNIFLIKTYLVNTIKPFSGHEKRFLSKSRKPLQGGYPKEPEFPNFEYLILFLDPKLLDKSAVRFVLW
jgi:hypothetical protein